MTTKIYVPGSEFTPTELNDLQDEYIQTGMEPWLTIGGAVLGIFGDIPKTYRATPHPLEDISGFSQDHAGAGLYLEAAEWPMSHNGSLRTLQCRLVVIFLLGEYPIGNVITSVSLKPFLSSGTAGAFIGTYGSAVSGSTITPGNLTATSTTLTFSSSAFSFPSTGYYAFEALSSGYGGVAKADMRTYLQIRGL